MMKKFALFATLPMLLISGNVATAQRAQLSQATTPSPSPPAAGVIPLGVTVIEMQAIVAGWSVRKDIIGKHVQNDRKEDLGKISDIIITQKDQAAFAIIGVGGFLGIAERLVAIPMRQLKISGDHFLLPGATKDVLTKMPPFVYAH